MRTATYQFRTSDYKGGYIRHTVRVEIIGESDKSYRVRYLEPGVSGDYTGTIKWVRKRHVLTPRAPRCDVRLPYKD